jgi:hypothetical protein
MRGLARRVVSQRYYSNKETSATISDIVSLFLDNYTDGDLIVSQTSGQWQWDTTSLLKMFQDLASVSQAQTADGLVGYILSTSPDKEINFRPRSWRKYTDTLPIEDFNLTFTGNDCISHVYVHGQPAFSFPQDGDGFTENTTAFWSDAGVGGDTFTTSISTYSEKGIGSIQITTDGTGDPVVNPEVVFGLDDLDAVDFTNLGEVEVSIAYDSGAFTRINNGAEVVRFSITTSRAIGGATTGFYYYDLTTPAAADTWQTDRFLFSNMTSNGAPEIAYVYKFGINFDTNNANWVAADDINIDGITFKFPEILGTASNTASAALYQHSDKHYSMPDIRNQTTATTIATNLLDRLDNPSINLSGSVPLYIPIELGEYITYRYNETDIDVPCSEINVSVAPDGSVNTDLKFGVPPISIDEIMNEVMKGTGFSKNRNSPPPIAGASGDELRDAFQCMRKSYTSQPCPGDCQDACQLACQAVCQSDCELICETACEVNCLIKNLKYGLIDSDQATKKNYDDYVV